MRPAKAQLLEHHLCMTHRLKQLLDIFDIKMNQSNTKHPPVKKIKKRLQYTL